jgi:ABC-2 type transport system permease protein
VSAVFRLVLRTQFTRGRAAALGAVGLLGLLLAFAVSRYSPGGRPQLAYNFVEGYGLGVLIPVTTLVFAAAALGDPAEDGTLVYIWLRPISRFRIAVAALAAAACIAIPFAVAPTVLAAAITGVGSDLVVATMLSSLVAVIAYSALFLGLGLLVRRALTWGLAYVLIWEGFVARSGTGPARLSILVYARSLLADVAEHQAPTSGASFPVAVAVPLVVGLVAVAATTWLLRRLDVK